MVDPDLSLVLVERWRGGDEQAARDLFGRYAGRLTAFARSRLSPRLAARIDPEDVVQSAYRSFFDAARAGRVSAGQPGEVWRLLAAITRRKVHRLWERHTATKRAVGRELAADAPDCPAPAPGPDEVAALADAVRWHLDRLEQRQRRAVELRLQGYQLSEIAVATRYSPATLKRLFLRFGRDFEAGAADRSGAP